MVTEKKSTKTTATETPATTFTVKELMNHSTVLKQPSEVIAGALYGTKEPVTLDDARKLIADFLKKPLHKEE